MKFIWNHLKAYKKLLFLALLLATINQFFSLLDPQVFRLIVDQYASRSSQMSSSAFFQGILLLLLAAVCVALISRIAKNFQDYYVNVISQRVGASLYARSVEHVLSLPYAVFEDQRSGEILQKLQKAKLDTQTVIASFINVIFLSIVGILFVVIYAFTVDWLVGLVYFLLIPVLGFSTFVISRKIKAAQKKVLAETSELAGSTTETLRNVELVKSLGLEGQEIKRLNDTNSRILELELQKVKLVRKLAFIQGTLINAMRSLLLLVMLILIFQGHVSLGQFFSLFIYSFFVFGPLAEFGNIAAQYQEARASNEQLDQILKIPSKPKTKNAVAIGKLHSVEFKDVSFKYQSGSERSLQQISLKLTQGTTVAFAGPSGSGKTTIIKLLLGLYDPTQGAILFNGIGMKKIDSDALRMRVGLVSQETQLFAGTIRENLLFVNPDATDKECLEAVRQASVLAILERGGKGLDTKIGEGGIKISGGERQRLAIARALLRNPDLLVFDEATSSLDSITEKAITKTIKKIIASRPNLIIVLVAHRLSTISHADTIYVLEKGRIVEQGSSRQLLAKKGLYWAFWREQASVDRS